MKKLLLSLALVFGVLSLSAAPVTVDFATAEGLPTDDASTEVATATINGVDFSFFHCKQGKYSGATYLQVCGGKYTGDNAAYVAFKSPIAAKNITVHTGSNASTNVSVQFYAGETAIGEPVVLDTKDKDFTFAVPAANQVEGTVFKLQTTNKYNAQFTTITISDGDAPVVNPDPDPIEDWNPVVGTETAEFNVKNATDIQGTHNEATDKIAENYQPLQSLKLGDFGFSFTSTNTNDSSQPAFYYSTVASGKDECTIRVYGQTSMTVTAPAECTIRTITFKGTNAKSLNSVQVSTGAINPNTGATAANLEWAGETDAVTFTFAGTYRILEAVITYDNHSATPAAAAPTFSREAGEFTEPFALTLSAAEGATIYYTLDGSVPTMDSDVYSAPIAISKTTTVKAVAHEEGKRMSPVATATYTLEVAYATLKELAEAGLADKNNVVKYSGEATVVYQNGQYLYLTDATAPLLAYGKLSTTYEPGDVITGFAGKMDVYNGLDELKVEAATFGEPVKKVAAPEPKTVDMEDITADDQNIYVRIVGVKVVATTSEDNKTTYTLVDQKDADIIAFPRFTGVDFPTDDALYNVYAITSVYKEDIQVYPIRFVKSAEDSVETINVANGAAVYYNLQGQRVAAPAKGQLVIKVQADKAEKIIF